MSFSCAQYIISALEIQYGFIDLCISECDYALLIALAALGEFVHLRGD